MKEVTQALLAAVPEDGGSIGNQALFELLKRSFPTLEEAQFLAARDGLIHEGKLLRGRGRGGSVRRAQEATTPDAGKAPAESPAYAAASVAEASAGYQVEAAVARGRARAAKGAPANGIAEINKTLWATADKLRANMDAAEYKHIVLGLIFLKYISDSFAGRRAELERKLTNPEDDYYLGDDDPEALNAELEDRDYYREVNVFWVPEVARWESIRAAAKQVDIGKRVDDALAAIEAENPKLKNILPSRPHDG
jgi:type I restriction enzyme M protein